MAEHGVLSERSTLEIRRAALAEIVLPCAAALMSERLDSEIAPMMRSPRERGPGRLL